MNKYLPQILPHVVAFAIFLILLLSYMSPVLEGKVLQQSDITQLKGVNSEIHQYFKEHGERIYWNNKQFSGMPEFSTHPSHPISFIHRIFTSFIPLELWTVMCLFVGMYITLAAFGLSAPLSFSGAFGYAFMSFNLISLEVGHVNKVLAMAFIPTIMGGVIIGYRGQLWKGALLVLFGLAFQVYYNHLQITYYTLIGVIVFVLIQAFYSVRESQLRSFVIRSAALLIFSVCAVLLNITTLWTMWDYQKSSNRGGTELTETGEKRSGLDKGYALAWSQGIGETMTLMIPYFYGGASAESLSKKSNTYEALVRNGVSRERARAFVQQIPLYHGDQSFVGGPVYIGAVFIFLFILALLYDDSAWKWWAIGATSLSILLSWGKNLEWFTDIFFYYVPLYNKFRTVSMALTLAQVVVVMYSLYFLSQLLKTESIDKKVLLNKLSIASGITAGISLLFVLVPSMLMDFGSPKDQLMKLPSWLLDAIKDDRVSLLKGDAFRSFFFITASAAGLYFTLVRRFKIQYFLIGLALITVIDHMIVSSRYLSKDDFEKRARINEVAYRPTEADKQILKDDSYFRVYDATKPLTQDGITSYNHYSINGYSAIKLGRYQELIDHHISKGNMKVFNMLNTKYFIQNKGGKPVMRQNPGACGNAWFVDSFQLVSNANEEIKALEKFSPEKTAIIDQRFGSFVESIQLVLDSSASIMLDSYHPENMVYSTNSSVDGLAVFSEIYYQPGWHAFIDGEKLDHFRVNYLLRGLVIPKGDHKVEFKFNPPSYAAGAPIAIGAIFLSILMVLIIVKFGDRLSGIEQTNTEKKQS